ncbi:transposase [Actinosynnema sp. NPDC050801]|uniref:transposase n=1 Tax=unclassified Actinosynnema TaxID=2637065 RepID=UPI00340CDF8B
MGVGGAVDPGVRGASAGSRYGSGGDRAVFTAIVYVLTSGADGWRELSPSFGVTVPTAHRRFTDWTKAALWWRLHQAVLD